MRVDAIGFVEVVGLVAAIEAGDAMVKAARVRLLKDHVISPGWTTVVVEGDLAACQAAVGAGRAAAARLGKVIGSLVIPRPDRDTEGLVLDRLQPGLSPDGAAPLPVRTAVPPVAATQAEKPAADELLSYVGMPANGRTCQEVARHFHIPSAAARDRLDRLVASGSLGKAGNRYVLPTPAKPRR